MNALEKYKQGVEQYKQEKAERGEVIELEMPSTKVTGLKWKLLPVQLGQYAVTGHLPLQLIAKLKASQNLSSAEVESKLSASEIEMFGLRVLEMTASVLLNNLIFPKITLEPTEDSITPEQIHPEDFEFFKNWLFANGAQADADLKSKKTSGKRKRVA